MSNIPLETPPNVLSPAVFIGGNLYGEDNKAVCRRFIQKIFNEGELSRLLDFLSPHAVSHELADSFGESGTSEAYNIEWMADLVYLYRHAFPDLHIEIQDQIAEEDRVVTCLRMRGTQTNALMTIPASGRKVDISGIRVDRMAGGKIVESWLHLDALGMLRQLDALPALNHRSQLAPVSYETVPGTRLPVAGRNPVTVLPRSALIS